MTGRKIPAAADLPDRGIRSTVAASRENQALVKAGVASRGTAAGDRYEPPRPKPLQQFATHADDKPKLKDLG